jgi:hypothetical protein
MKSFSVGITNEDLWWMLLRWPQIIKHIHTKSHDDRFRHSSNIKRITWTIWEVIVLLLMGRGISDVSHWDGLRRHDIYITSFMKTGTDVQTILRFCLNNSNGCNIGITDVRRLCSALLRWDHATTWYTQKFSGRLVQEFKQYEGFRLSNLNGCNVGITDGRDLCNAPLRWG